MYYLKKTHYVSTGQFPSFIIQTDWYKYKNTTITTITKLAEAFLNESDKGFIDHLYNILHPI